jgi:hypothetical protein
MLRKPSPIDPKEERKISERLDLSLLSDEALRAKTEELRKRLLDAKAQKTA